jgi:hypothetical protein
MSRSDSMSVHILARSWIATPPRPGAGTGCPLDESSARRGTATPSLPLDTRIRQLHRQHADLDPTALGLALPRVVALDGGAQDRRAVLVVRGRPPLELRGAYRPGAVVVLKHALDLAGAHASVDLLVGQAADLGGLGQGNAAARGFGGWSTGGPGASYTMNRSVPRRHAVASRSDRAGTVASQVGTRSAPRTERPPRVVAARIAGSRWRQRPAGSAERARTRPARTDRIRYAIPSADETSIPRHEEFTLFLQIHCNPSGGTRQAT